VVGIEPTTYGLRNRRQFLNHAKTPANMRLSRWIIARRLAGLTRSTVAPCCAGRWILTGRLQANSLAKLGNGGAERAGYSMDNQECGVSAASFNLPAKRHRDVCSLGQIFLSQPEPAPGKQNPVSQIC